jgi:hypothetical protein
MKLKNYLKYSGIWIGIVVNPYHWSFGVKKYDTDCLHLGPLWIRVYIGCFEDY